MNTIYVVTDEIEQANAEINHFCKGTAYRSAQLSWTFPNARPARKQQYRGQR